MQQIGFWMLTLVWSLTVVVGLAYALTKKVIPYHGQVLGDALRERVSTFYFVTINNVGFIILAYALVSGYLLFGLVRLGDVFAMGVWFLSTVIVAVSGGVGAWKLHRATGANTPWRPIAGLGVFGLAASLIWFAGRFALVQ